MNGWFYMATCQFTMSECVFYSMKSDCVMLESDELCIKREVVGNNKQLKFVFVVVV